MDNPNFIRDMGYPISRSLRDAAAHDQEFGQTWDDVLKAAVNDPVLTRLVHWERQPGVTREQALIQVVMFLAADRRAQLDEAVTRAMNAPPKPMWLCADCPHKAKILNG
jgi:hypothetical protein